MFKNLITKNLLIIISFLMPFNLSAEANNTLEHNDLLRQVITFVEQKISPSPEDNIKITALPIDARIRLTKCSQQIKFETANNRSFTRQFPIKVSCQDEKPWKTYVQVIVSEVVETVILTRNVLKGTRIEPEMLSVMSIDKHNAKDRRIVDPDLVTGGRAMKNLTQGYQIGQTDVCLVCKGDDVAIIAKSNSMMIKTSGTAIEDGSIGDSIKVKNSSSKRIIKGIIGDLREVYVNL